MADKRLQLYRANAFFVGGVVLVISCIKIESVYYGIVLCLASHCRHLSSGLRQHLYNILMAEKNLRTCSQSFQ